MTPNSAHIWLMHSGGCENKASEMKEAEAPAGGPAGVEAAVAENGG